MGYKMRTFRIAPGRDHGLGGPLAQTQDGIDESTGDEHVTPKARRGKAAAQRKSPSVEAEARPDDGEGSQSGSPLPSLTPSEEGRS